MREFNLEQALAGAPVWTRDGRPVTQLTAFDCAERFSLAGVVSRLLYLWDENGNPCHIGTNEDRCLCMAPVKKVGWVARYTEYWVGGKIFTSEEQAKHEEPEALSYHEISWEE